MVQEGEVKVVRCSTQNMRADSMTKFLPEITLVRHDAFITGAVREEDVTQALFSCSTVVDCPEVGYLYGAPVVASTASAVAAQIRGVFCSMASAE